MSTNLASTRAPLSTSSSGDAHPVAIRGGEAVVRVLWAVAGADGGPAERRRVLGLDARVRLRAAAEQEVDVVGAPEPRGLVQQRAARAPAPLGAEVGADGVDDAREPVDVAHGELDQDVARIVVELDRGGARAA